MVVTRLSLRNFRSYEAAEVRLGPGLTVVTGPNGAGKTNLLEAIYFACTGRSCRTGNEREVVRFGAGVARLELDAERDGDAHRITVGFEPGEAKRLQVDGATVDKLTDTSARPLVSVFLPDRLDLVLGRAGAAARARRPGDRRAVAGPRRHPPRLHARRWRSATRCWARSAPAAPGAARSPPGISSWRATASRWPPTAPRSSARLAEPFAEHAEALGLEGGAELSYRPRSRAETAEALAAELAERTDSDLDRGFTGHGPHRDELVLKRAGRELRTYGSRGQQRLGLLSLLLAERGVLAAERGAAPLMLLDDVTSELDSLRRERLVEALREGGGQSVIATTDLAHVPGGDDARRRAPVGGRGQRAGGGAGVRRDRSPPGRRGARPLHRRARPRDPARRGPAGLAGGRRRGVRGRLGAGLRARRNGHRGVHLGGLGAGARPALRTRHRAPERRARAPRRQAPARTGSARPPDDRAFCAFLQHFLYT